MVPVGTVVRNGSSLGYYAFYVPVTESAVTCGWC